ncbi:MAG: Cna B-type domain-containing protein, partial [Clostridia bacterium]|nr:Cna B-type domain-containing protein [Clostridia bacterium]
MRNFSNDLVKIKEGAVRTSAPFGTELVKGTAPQGRPYALLRGWFLLIALVILTLGLSALPAVGLGEESLILTVQKQWLDEFGEPVTDELPESAVVNISRTRTHYESDPRAEVTLIVKDSDGGFNEPHAFQRGTTAIINYSYNPNFVNNSGGQAYYTINNGENIPASESGSFTVTIPESGQCIVVFHDGWDNNQFGGASISGIDAMMPVIENDTNFSQQITVTAGSVSTWDKSISLVASETVDSTKYIYTYYLSENPVSGWNSSVSANGVYGVNTDATVTITNSKPLVFSVTKQWENSQDEWPSDSVSVGLTLQRRTGSNAFVDVETVYVTKNENSKQFASVDRLDGSGNEYEYRVVEKNPQDGYFAFPSSPSGTLFVINNIPNADTVDVTMEKTWDEQHVTNNMAWEATFELEVLEYPYDPAEYDAQNAYNDVESGNYTADSWHNAGHDLWTVQSWNGTTKRLCDLPKFGVNSNGDIVILMYSVTEKGYKVWDNSNGSGDPIYSLVGEEYTGDILFAPEYLEDASDYTSYTIYINNVERLQKNDVSINFDLKKQWVSENGVETPDEGSYAEFQLKRYSHEEYKKLDDPEVDYSEFVTVKIVDGGGRTLTSLQVEKGAPVKLQAAFHAGTSGNVVFVNLNDQSDHVEIAGSALPYQHLCASDSFRVYEDVTYRYSSGSERLADGLAGVVISDRCDGAPTTDAEDAAFTAADYRYQVDNSTGYKITYNNGEISDEQTTDAWKIEFVNFPQTVINTGVSRETTTVYGYYFEEVAANPGTAEGYTAHYYMADASGNPTNIENGTKDNRIYFDGSVIAENEKKFLLVKKYWESQVQEDIPNIVVDIKQVVCSGLNINNIESADTYKRVILSAGNGFEYKLYDVATKNTEGSYYAYIPVEVGLTTLQPGQEDQLNADTIISFDNDFNNPGNHSYILAEYGTEINYARIKADNLALSAPNNFNDSIKQAILESGTGTVCLVNNPAKTGYQLAIRKRWHKFTTEGGMTTENDYSGAYFTAMLVQIIYDDDQDSSTYGEKITSVDYGDTFDWKYDGNSDFHYNDPGNETNITIRYTNGQWLVVIPEGNGFSGSNLPEKGYYTMPDGTTKKVRYDYTVREISITSTDGYHWALSDHISEGSAQDAYYIDDNGNKVQINNAHLWFLDNYPDADLKIIKHWPVLPEKKKVTEVYFKITSKEEGKDGLTNVIEKLVDEGRLAEHQLTLDDVVKYNDEWCLVVRGQADSTEDWIGYIDHLPLFDFSNTVFNNNGIAGAMPGELNYNVEEVAAVVNGEEKPVGSDLYIPYYRVTTRGTVGSIRASAEGIQLGMYDTEKKQLQPTIVEVTNNEVLELDVSKLFFDEKGLPVLEPVNSPPPEFIFSDNNGNDYTINKVTFVIKVTGEKTTTTFGEDGKVVSTETETRTGYVTQNWGSGQEMADISGAYVYELTSNDRAEDGITWKKKLVQGLPSIVVNDTETTSSVEVFTYEIVETHVYATADGQDDIDVLRYFKKNIEVDPNDAEEWTISNTRTEYSAEGSLTLTGKKALEGRELQPEEFEFILLKGNTVVGRAKNDANGSIVFSALIFNQDDMKVDGEYLKTRKYTYTMKEVYGGEDMIIYASNSYDITVTITDDGSGTLIVNADRDGADNVFSNTYYSMTFTNEYKADGTIVLSGEKVLEGRDIQDTDNWTVTLEPVDGAPLHEYSSTATLTSLSKTMALTAGGKSSPYQLGMLYYTNEDLYVNGVYQVERTFAYKVTESGTVAGVTNDGNSYTLVVTVSDADRNGNLTVSAKPDPEALDFTNKYEAKGSTVLTGVKILEGRELEDGQFGFELKDAAGKVWSSTSNTATGLITFPALEYTQSALLVDNVYLKSREFTYTFTEVQPKESAEEDGY